MNDAVDPILKPLPFTAEIPQGRIGSSVLSGSGAAVRDVPETLGSLEETTLDEPVITTVLRDVRMVLGKMKKVILMSADTRDELRNWCVKHSIFRVKLNLCSYARTSQMKCVIEVYMVLLKLF
jgi:hypothetical protein